MLRSGTIKTLGALVVALSVGALVLLWLERLPARPEVPLQAVTGRTPAEHAIIHRTDVPLQHIKWRNVIVHDIGKDGPAIAEQCHFLIGSAEKYGDGAIVSTRLWRLQKAGAHIYVPGHSFEDSSIGVCLLVDSRRSAPTRRQLAAAIHVVRGLQVTCQIPPDRVYLHSELGEQGCPGRHFQGRTFRDRLIPATR